MKKELEIGTCFYFGNADKHLAILMGIVDNCPETDCRGWNGIELVKSIAPSIISRTNFSSLDFDPNCVTANLFSFLTPLLHFLVS